jgi:hypothetical protein
MLEEHIAQAIQKNAQALDELGRWDRACQGSHVPRPAILGKAAHPPAQSQESIPKENASLDEMSKAVEDVVATLI